MCLFSPFQGISFISVWFLETRASSPWHTEKQCRFFLTLLVFNSEFDTLLQKSRLINLFQLWGFIYSFFLWRMLGILRLLGQVAPQFFFVYMFPYSPQRFCEQLQGHSLLLNHKSNSHLKNLLDLNHNASRFCFIVLILCIKKQIFSSKTKKNKSRNSND